MHTFVIQLVPNAVTLNIMLKCSFLLL